MNKEELIAEVACRTGFTKKDCMLLVDVFCDVIADSLGRGEQVKIVNFGVFKVKKSAQRTGRNFANSSTYPIPSRNVPIFVPGMKLKELIGGADCGD